MKTKNKNMKKYIFPLLLLAISACGAKAQDSSTDPQDQVIAVADRMAAPDFTLQDINGKSLSLSELKGKWVILDFWGSWCPWCIKGFPALKDAYKQYDGKVEVLGIDCGDTEEVWKASVAKHELPWPQVYNPKGSDLTARYGIQGFPTKFIIDPEGRVANVTVGEDPAFFDILKSLVKQLWSGGLHSPLPRLIMNCELKEGLSHKSTAIVVQHLTAKAIGSGDLPVLATPAMIALMENASMLAVAPYLDANHTTVGGYMECSHLAPTAMGDEIEAEAILVKLEGKSLHFDITAFANNKKIGEGRHIRYIVDRDCFLSKLA